MNGVGDIDGSLKSIKRVNSHEIYLDKNISDNTKKPDFIRLTGPRLIRNKRGKKRFDEIRILLNNNLNL